MKLKVLLWATLLATFHPPPADCQPVEPPSVLRPLLLHQGEEFSLRLGGGETTAPESAPSVEVRRAQLRLAQRLLLAGAEQVEKRSEESPISLDLTFHLLREVLEMARAEQLAQQADTNRRMMDTFGK